MIHVEQLQVSADLRLESIRFNNMGESFENFKYLKIALFPIFPFSYAWPHNNRLDRLKICISTIRHKLVGITGWNGTTSEQYPVEFGKTFWHNLMRVSTCLMLNANRRIFKRFVAKGNGEALPYHLNRLHPF